MFALFGCAFDITLSMPAWMLVMISANLISAVPITPSNIGAYEVAITELLKALGVEAGAAAAFAIAAHVFNILWITVAGFGSMWALRLTFDDVFSLGAKASESWTGRSPRACRSRKLGLWLVERHHAPVDVDPFLVAHHGDFSAVIVEQVDAVVVRLHAPYAQERASAAASRFQCAGFAVPRGFGHWLVGAAAGGGNSAVSLPVSSANGGYSSTSEPMYASTRTYQRR